MSNIEYEHLEDAFEHIISLPPAAKSAFLNELKVSSPKLYAQLLNLLNNDQATDSALRQPIEGVIQAKSQQSHWLGRTLGAFKITRQIGSGGMGVVFEGERNEGEFEQKVAIKLLNGIIASEAVGLAFDNEKHIIALMHHPYIAQLYDGGTTQDGVPFLVMEYVHGVPIDEYCEQQQLSIKATLALFIDVCSAVAYAHQNLIVHRDIKPSNILVDGNGKPKLLDFGIAKHLTESKGVLTKLGHTPFTPQNASPEQLAGERITTASDIYSLGILLFHMLSGAPAFSHEKSALVTTRNAPTSPSKALGQLLNQKHSKRLNPQLQKKLKGDLDAIVLHALKYQPEHRYPTVQAFVDDVKRYLNGQPVMARPYSLAYRINKYISRHWIPVTAISITVIGLGLAFLVTRNALTQEQLAKSAALVELQKAESVSSFLTDVFAAADPREMGRDVKVIDLLAQAEQEAQSRFAQQPEIQADLLVTFAKTHSGLSDYTRATYLFEKALALYQQFFGPKHIKSLTTENLLAENLIENNQTKIASQQWGSLLPRVELILGKDHPLAMTVTNNLTQYLIRDGYAAFGGKNPESLLKARVMAEQLLKRREQVLGEWHLETAHSRNTLAVILGIFDQFEEALVLNQKNYAAHLKIAGQENLYSLITQQGIAYNLVKLERFEQALKYGNASLNGLLKMQGSSGTNTLNTLKFMLKLQHKLDLKEDTSLTLKKFETVVYTNPKFLTSFTPEQQTYIVEASQL